MSKSKLIAEQIKRIRPLLKEANPQQKLKLMKLMKVALKENFDERMALIRKLVRTGEYDASDLELATTEELEQLLADQHGIDEGNVNDFTHPGWSNSQQSVDQLLKNYNANKAGTSSPQPAPKPLIIPPLKTGSVDGDEKDVTEEQAVPLSGKISARPNQDPNSFEDWDYYYQGKPIQPGTDIHTKVKDLHMRQSDPAYDTMRNAFDNPIQPGSILPQDQSGDTIIPSVPKPKEFVTDPNGKPIRLKDFVPHDPDIMEEDLVSDTELSNIDPDDHGETEGRFVKNQIQTMLRVLSHLENAIGDDENLPEWVEMLLSQSQDKIVGVMDYMISAKERAREEQTGSSSLMKELRMMEEKVRLDPHCWKNKHKEGTKIKGGVRVNNCAPNKKKVKESKDFLQEK